MKNLRVIFGTPDKKSQIWIFLRKKKPGAWINDDFFCAITDISSLHITLLGRAWLFSHYMHGNLSFKYDEENSDFT